MPSNILFTNQEIEWIQSLMVAYFQRTPDARDRGELANQAEILAAVTAANTIPPANCTFSEVANEWMQMVVQWYLWSLIVRYTDEEMFIGQSVMTKLQAGDTL